GRPRRRCPAITGPQMMCPTVCRSRAGPGMDLLPGPASTTSEDGSPRHGHRCQPATATTVDVPSSPRVPGAVVVPSRACRKADAGVSSCTLEPGAFRDHAGVAKMRAAVGSLLFLLIAPGVVAGLVPWLITRWSAHDWFLPVRVLGAALIAAGLTLLLPAF